jgi:F-type H+-transporting ATPase subunit b
VTLLALMAQPHEGGQIAQIASTFGVAWPLLITQTISFAIVCALLYRFAYGPILRMLDERRKQIAQGLANAAEINAKLASIEAQRQGVIAEARNEAAGIVTQARTVARRLQEEEKQIATSAAEQIVRRAHEASEMDRARMMTDLKQEVGRLVVQTSAAVIGTVMTPADHRRLAEETARQLGRTAGSGTGAA